MKNYKRKSILYLFAVKWRWVFYIVAVLIVLIPISMVLVTGIPFSAFYSKIYIVTSITFVIVGRLLALYNKTLEDEPTPWYSIGSIIGLLIALIWIIMG